MSNILFFDKRVMRLRGDRRLVEMFDREFGPLVRDYSYPERVSLYRRLIYASSGGAEIVDFPIGGIVNVKV